MKSYLISAILGVAALVMAAPEYKPESTATTADVCPCGDACQCDPCECGDALSIAAPIKLVAQAPQSPFVPNETDRLQDELDSVKASLDAANQTIEKTNQALSAVQAKAASWDSGLVGPRLSESDVIRIVNAETAKLKAELQAEHFTEDQIRTFAREEAEKVYAAKVTVKTTAGETRTQTVKTSAVSPGQIVLNPGEVLVEIDGVPVQQSAVYGASARYVTPTYSAEVPRTITRSTNVPVYRTPIRRALGNVFMQSSGQCGPGGCN